MPSPTSKTSPTSFVSILSRYLPISSVNTETISLALMRLDIAASLNELVPNSLQTRPHATVVDPVVHAHHQAAQQVGIDANRQNRLAFELFAQFLTQPFLLVVRQRSGGAHVNVHASGTAFVKGA